MNTTRSATSIDSQPIRVRLDRILRAALTCGIVAISGCIVSQPAASARSVALPPPVVASAPRPIPPTPSTAQATATVLPPPAETIRRFADVEWSCDGEGGVLRRVSGGDWFRQDDGKRLPLLAGEHANWVMLDMPGDSHPACEFLDGDHAWILSGSVDLPIRVAVHATSDGGAHWTTTLLGVDDYTSGGPSDPRGRLRFTNATHGTAETIDMPGHHNGHTEKRLSFETRDGGLRWTRTRVSARCLDVAHGCKQG